VEDIVHFLKNNWELSYIEMLVRGNVHMAGMEDTAFVADIQQHLDI
jgi:hypothetical protein